MKEATIRQQGNSLVIGLSKETLQLLGWKKGDVVGLKVKEIVVGDLGKQKILEIEKLVRPSDLISKQRNPHTP